MGHDDFYELFFSNLKKELNDDNFIYQVEYLVNSNRFNKRNFINLIEEEIR